MNYFVPYVKYDLRSSGASFPSADPYVFLRFQTHTGDNIPISLYQDLAKLTPADSSGHFIAAWEDIYSSGNPTIYQSDPTKRPQLNFISGVPVVRFNGSGSFLSGLLNWGTGGAVGSIAYRPYSDNSYSAWDNRPNTDSYFCFSGVGQMGVMRTSRINNYPISMPTGGLHVISVSSFNDYKVYVDGTSQGARSGAYTSGNNSLLLGIGYDATGGISNSKSLNGDVYGLMVGKFPIYRERFENYFQKIIF